METATNRITVGAGGILRSPQIYGLAVLAGLFLAGVSTPRAEADHAKGAPEDAGTAVTRSLPAVLVRFDGGEVTATEVREAIRPHVIARRAAGLPMDAGFVRRRVQGAVKLLVDRKLLLAEAERDGYVPDVQAARATIAARLPEAEMDRAARRLAEEEALDRWQRQKIRAALSVAPNEIVAYRAAHSTAGDLDDAAVRRRLRSHKAKKVVERTVARLRAKANIQRVSLDAEDASPIEPNAPGR